MTHSFRGRAVIMKISFQTVTFSSALVLAIENTELFWTGSGHLIWGKLLKCEYYVCNTRCSSTNSLNPVREQLRRVHDTHFQISEALCAAFGSLSLPRKGDSESADRPGALESGLEAETTEFPIGWGWCETLSSRKAPQRVPACF